MIPDGPKLGHFEEKLEKLCFSDQKLVEVLQKLGQLASVRKVNSKKVPFYIAGIYQIFFLGVTS